MATDITVGGTSISYRDFSIDIPLSPAGVAPTATIITNSSESISANDAVEITIDGTTRFSGVATSGGEIRSNGGVRLEAEHEAVKLFEEQVNISLSGTFTNRDVLDEALAQANIGGQFTLDYNTTGTTIGNDYDVENRTVKRVFQDMADRTSTVWWVNPAADEINVNTEGGRGIWETIDTETDKAVLQQFDSGGLESVRNDVTIVGTGAEQVTGTATDGTSISTYGRQSETINVSYITTTGEADAMASELLIPDPLASGKLLVGQNVGTVAAPLVNRTIDLTDDAKGVSATDLVIEKQTIEQGRATLTIGEGSGVNLASVNRKSKSAGDTTEPGSVYGSDRIGDNSIDSNQLVDSAVIEQKLDDLAVTLNKVDFDAIDETKIQDDSISTPKLQAAAVVASKIASDTITANEIAAGTITALEIAADTLTANQIDTLDLETNQLTLSDPGLDGVLEFQNEQINGVDTIEMLQTDAGGFGAIGTFGQPWDFVFSTRVRPDSDNVGFVGESSAAYSEVWAYDYFDAATDSTINDGGDVLAGLAEGHGPPDHCIKCDDDGTELGTDLSKLSHSLMDICRAQQRKIEDLEDRLSALEGDNA